MNDDLELVEDENDPFDAEAREREEQVIRGLSTAYHRLKSEIQKVIIGQDEVIDELLIALFLQRSLFVSWCTRVSENTSGEHSCQDFTTVVSSNSVHSRSHAIGHYRNRRFAR